MGKLHVIQGSGKDPGEPVAEIYMRQNLGAHRLEELRTTLERSAKGAFSVQELGARTTVEVSSVEDLNLVRSSFANIIDGWREITADDE